MEKSKGKDIESEIGYTFKDKNLLKKALTHKSFVLNHNRSNEVLEFLGDSIVGFYLADKLINLFPYLEEGDLSKLRALFSSRKFLFNLANKIGLGNFLYLGKSEKKERGWEKVNIVSSAFEAIVGAIKIDGGLKEALNFLEKLYAPHLKQFERKIVRINDYKSEVQEIFQKEGGELPQYTVIEERGPEHNKTFKIAMKNGEGSILSTGEGKTKKEAEQDAAKKYIEKEKLDSNTLFFDDFFIEIKDE